MITGITWGSRGVLAEYSETGTALWGREKHEKNTHHAGAISHPPHAAAGSPDRGRLTAGQNVQI